LKTTYKLNDKIVYSRRSCCTREHCYIRWQNSGPILKEHLIKKSTNINLKKWHIGKNSSTFCSITWHHTFGQYEIIHLREKSKTELFKVLTTQVNTCSVDFIGNVSEISKS